MKAREIVIISIVATCCMTLFSYLMSIVVKEDFREPYFLEQILQFAFPHQAKELSFLEGWVIHFLVGGIFVMIYSTLWRNDSIPPGAKTGSVLGVGSGIIAVFCWALVLHAFPNLTQANRCHYYFQLVLAHLIFGVSAAWVYRLLKNRIKS